MIIQTGMRTDIPAFYAPWLANRLKAGFVMVRSPWNSTAVTRYRLSPDVVDCVGFCTKNPRPMFRYMDLLRPYGQFWYVTITPYGRDVEPNVPPVRQVLDDFRALSEIVGADAVGWRYDPIFIDERYTPETHLRAFEAMAAALEGATRTVVISFIDLYEKVKRNFPEVRPVPEAIRLSLGEAMAGIARRRGMVLKPCAEGDALAAFGADCSGCMTVPMFEKAIGQNLKVPAQPGARRACACLLSRDIGAYDTCAHLCRYCYANADAAAVRANRRRHDPQSPLLIGHLRPEDVVREAGQVSWIDGQQRMIFN